MKIKDIPGSAVIRLARDGAGFPKLRGRDVKGCVQKDGSKGSKADWFPELTPSTVFCNEHLYED